MEISSTENSQQTTTISSNDVEHQQPDNPVPDVLNHGVMETKIEMAHEEVKGILELIASTGKFWHDWEKLKILLSFQLKQVLSEYAEAKMSDDLQNSTLGETFLELVQRLDKALSSFIDGPPFTLQRLCEILLTARSIYPNLSKLALALEKNLLVTSTLTMCTDPYPPSLMQNPDEPEKVNEEPQLHSNLLPNGIEAMVGDGDEIMAEVEEADIGEDMTIDMEAFEEIVGTSEASSTPDNSN